MFVVTVSCKRKLRKFLVQDSSACVSTKSSKTTVVQLLQLDLSQLKLYNRCSKYTDRIAPERKRRIFWRKMRRRGRWEAVAICLECAARPQVLSPATTQQHIHLRVIKQF